MVSLPPLSQPDTLRLIPTQPGEHVWVACATYRLTADHVLSDEGDYLIGADNLAMIEAGCMICDLIYRRDLFNTLCPGVPDEPKWGTPP